MLNSCSLLLLVKSIQGNEQSRLLNIKNNNFGDID